MTAAEPAWELEDVEEAHADNPKTFMIADRDEREALPVGTTVKLTFLIDQVDEEVGPYLQGERLHAKVAERRAGRYVGVLEEGSSLLRELAVGTRIPFGPEHVATIIVPSSAPRPDGGG